MIDTLKNAIGNPLTGLVSSFVGVGVSLLDIEIWLRVAGLTIGLTIGLLNLICLLTKGKFWFCRD